MKLHVKYTGQLRTTVGRSEEDVELAEGSNLGALLRHIAAQLGSEAAPHLVGTNDQIPHSLLVVINERAIAGHAADSTVLHESDVVTLLPPIAGG
jgi:molybdopterin converting factor small subunit